MQCPHPQRSGAVHHVNKLWRKASHARQGQLWCTHVRAHRGHRWNEEADELADRIAIIDEGLVVAEGTSDELKASIGGDVITFSFETDEGITKAQKVLTDSIQEKMELRITVEDGASKIPGYLKELSIAGIEVSSVTASKPTLDDVFLEVTGYRLEGSEEPVEENPTPTRRRGR